MLDVRSLSHNHRDWKIAVFRHVAIMRGFHVILHLVRPRELFPAHRTWEDFALRPLVIEESVSLEAVLVLERFLNVVLRALSALIHTILDARIAK